MPDLPPVSAAPKTAIPWDARLARRMVWPLRHGPVTPNHLTTIRLAFGLAGAGALAHGGYAWMNLGALLLVISNFLDHADGELARISGKGSRLGHWYDLASDALVTVLLFAGIGAGVSKTVPTALGASPLLLGTIAGLAVALVFLLRMRIEEVGGKPASQQASAGGFQTEDVLYLLPLVTVSNGAVPFLVAAAGGAPLFALWVVFDYLRLTRVARQ